MIPPHRCVFLDRDGVINQAVVRDGMPFAPETVEGFHILPGVKEACDRLKAAGYLLIVATNQPDVSRGTVKLEVVEAMHARLRAELPLDAIEVCYHPGYGEDCPCRKPKPGLLTRAAETFSIDLQRSFMVGDRWRDVDCGANAGCRTVFLDYHYAEALRQQPTFTASNLPAAAEIILRNP